MSTNLQRLLTAALPLAAALALAAPRAAAQTQYKIDDGTPEGSLGIATAYDYVWVNRFHTVATYDTITEVEIMFSDVPNGTPVTVCVWEDVGDYGDANMLYPLAIAQGTVANTNQPIFNTFRFPPVKAKGYFFAGAFMTVDTQYPATRDANTAPAHRCYIGFDAPGYLDPSALPVMYALETVGVGGVFMIRAKGTGSEYPGVTLYGDGTPGCSGASKLAATAAPKVGNASFALSCDKGPALALGLCLVTDAQDLAGSDPYGLGVKLHVSIAAASQVFPFDAPSNAAGASSTGIPIPNNPALVGLTYYGQVLWGWPAGSCPLPPYQLSSSNGVALKIQP